MRFSKEDSNGGGNGADYRYDRELPDGTYDADVLDAREDKSKKGNDMVVLSFAVTGPHGGGSMSTSSGSSSRRSMR